MVQRLLNTEEAPRLQFIHVVGEIPDVVQRQISMQDKIRADSNWIWGIICGKDEFF